MKEILILGTGFLGFTTVAAIDNYLAVQTPIENTLPEQRFPISSFPLLPEPIILKENQYHDGRSNRAKRREAERNLKKKRRF